MKKTYISVKQNQKFAGRILTIALLLLVAGVSFVSCKGTRNIPDGRLLTVSEAQSLAEKNPGRRAWGSYNSPVQRQAVQGASAYARAEAAAFLKARIKSVLKDHPEMYEQIATSTTDTKSVTDANVVGKSGVDQIIDEIVRGYATIKTNVYVQDNGSYTAYACVEYIGTLPELAKDVSNSMRQLISNDDKLLMDFNFQKFQEDMEKELKDYEEKLDKELGR